MSGNTKYVAEKIAEKAGADLIEIKPEKQYPDKGFRKFLWGGKSAVMGDTPKLLPYEFDADKYDTIVFGYPVWASNFTPPIKTFIKENMEKIAGKDFAVYACSMGGGAEKSVDKLKNYLIINEFKAAMSLIDPKDKPSEENNKKIEEFISELEK
jgi:flavodoxin